MTVEPIRYGIVGLGRAGWPLHFEALCAREDARVVAVADPLAERRREAADLSGCQTHRSIGGLLKQPDVEVVVIASPSVRHGPDARRALRAGKHVVVEKPMALSVKEADGMLRTAAETGMKLFVHQNYRYQKVFVHLKGVLDSGALGRLYHVRNYGSFFLRRNDWQTLSANGGGVLNNTCPHNVDILLQMMGAPIVQVMGDLKQIASAGDTEDHVKAFLRAENGCTADLEISSAQNIALELPLWVLCGSCGTVTIDAQGRSTLRWFNPAEAPPLEAVAGAVAGRRYGNDDQLPWQERVVDVETQTPDSGSFYDNLAAVLRRGEPMAITGESVREVIRVLALVRKGSPFPGRPLRRHRARG